MLLCNLANLADLESKAAKSFSLGLSSIPAAIKLRITPTKMNGLIKTLWIIDHKITPPTPAIININICGSDLTAIGKDLPRERR